MHKFDRQIGDGLDDIDHVSWVVLMYHHQSLTNSCVFRSSGLDCSALTSDSKSARTQKSKQLQGDSSALRPGLG